MESEDTNLDNAQNQVLLALFITSMNYRARSSVFPSPPKVLIPELRFLIPQRQCTSSQSLSLFLHKLSLADRC